MNLEQITNDLKKIKTDMNKLKNTYEKEQGSITLSKEEVKTVEKMFVSSSKCDESEIDTSKKTFLRNLHSSLTQISTLNESTTKSDSDSFKVNTQDSDSSEKSYQDIQAEILSF